MKKEGETTEVEWQKSLSRIAEGKGRRFVQMDFSATPYNDVGNSKHKRKLYFPHIVVDFDLKDAMRMGLVKSLVLDKRKAIGALPLEFKAERDEGGNVRLSEGQTVMLRAGLQKLRKLEADFARVDPERHPKMLVVCGDTRVSPLVAQFMQDEGLHEDDVLTVDSGKKAELGEKEWAPLRQRLFNVDQHAQPRVIVSVLMLREGFDVNNICVIVPLRASQAQILVEQLIGRGLRLMWRDKEFADLLFGDYRGDGSVMNVSGYNELLSRLTRRIDQALSQPLPKGNRIAEHLATPYLQVNTVGLATALDDYIRECLFREPFEPFADEGWRLLLLQQVIDHIVKVFGLALVRAEDRAMVGETEVRHRRLSEVTRLMVRESSSLEVDKCIYTRLAYPSRSGGLERAFIEWAQADSSVEAFCKLSENRHEFVRLRYVKDDGLPAFYFPGFLVRTADDIYMVETKAQQQTTHPNVQRKLKAAATWCERINGLAPDDRNGHRWHYALLGESLFWDWKQNGARLADLLAFARVRPAPRADAQGDLSPQERPMGAMPLLRNRVRHRAHEALLR